MIVVGVAGRLKSGKDTAADVLVQEFGFARVSFADALKEEVLRTLPRTLRAILRLNTGWVPSDADVRRAVYETKPEGVRELLQEWGTDLRRAEDPAYWIRKWYQRAFATGSDRIVVPDMRFPNEYEAVTIRRGCPLEYLGAPWAGVTVRVERSGLSAPTPDRHVSETALEGYPVQHVLLNDAGSAEEFRARVWSWARPLWSAR